MISDEYGPNIGTEAHDFFQSDRDIAIQQRQELKKQSISKTAGEPRELATKVLRFELADPLGLSTEPFVVYTAESGRVARKYDLKSGKTLCVFKGHSGPVSSLTLQFDSQLNPKYLFTGSWDKSIIQWDVNTGDQVRTFTGHNDFIKSLKLLGKYIFSSSSDSTIRQWDIESGKEVKVFKEHSRAVEDIVFDEDAKYLYSSSSDTTIKKWDIETGSCVATFQGHLTSVYQLHVFDGSLWSVSADKTVKRWDVESGKSDLSFEHPDFVKCLVTSGSYVITGCRDENIRLWNIATEKLEYVLEGHYGEVSGLRVRDNTLFSSGLDATIRRWSLKEADLKKAQTPKLVVEKKKVSKKATMLTAEEEDELAELMADD